MPWEVPIKVGPFEYPVTFNTENEPTQEDIDDAVKQIIAGQQQEEPGFISRLGSALSTGTKQTLAGAKGTFNAYTSDNADLAEALHGMNAANQEYQAGQTEGEREFARGLEETSQNVKNAQGFFPTAKAASGYLTQTLRHPKEAILMAAQSAPNALVSGGTALAGRAIGAGLGAAAGLETGPGAIATGIAGGVAGAGISNAAIETPHAINDVLMERTNGQAAYMNPQQIKEVLDRDPSIISEVKKVGLIRGAVIGAVESLGLHGATKLVSLPERAAMRSVQRELMSKGVDVASKKAVDNALLDPALKKTVANVYNKKIGRAHV